MYSSLLCVQFLTNSCLFHPNLAKLRNTGNLHRQGGYVPENCRKWQNRKRRDISENSGVTLLDSK